MQLIRYHGTTVLTWFGEEIEHLFTLGLNQGRSGTLESADGVLTGREQGTADALMRVAGIKRGVWSKGWPAHPNPTLPHIRCRVRVCPVCQPLTNLANPLIRCDLPILGAPCPICNCSLGSPGSQAVPCQACWWHARYPSTKVLSTCALAAP